MSGLFPEPPVLFYPSIAQRYGAEEAILLAIYDQYARHHGDRDETGCYFIARRNEWLALAPFWEEDQLAQITNSLVSQQVLEAEFRPNGSIRIQLPAASGKTQGTERVLTEPEEEPAPASRPSLAPPAPQIPRSMPAPRVVVGSGLPRGPAPSFGGSTGWRRPKDDLEHLFESRERQNRLLQEITLEWRPSETTYQLLGKRNIPVEFIDDCIDEFISYWMERGSKKHTWDSEFIKRVNVQWVKAQSRQARAERQGWEQRAEGSGERDQSNNRAERRERITDAVMDIHNTDW
ncbi:DnaT-like ssDNA-binding domain-containing protein [Motiliproteus sp. SC1-56]|uniref:DnaT-like ssDNA-binding domain-containing protein n=1 Tax=Motiliproteus sp. SC1-56 TaxID=2799565 RepID=UPI001A8DBFA4|nr:DnaT-like ssDNA-binding domain-containing protein [Motiliproteus sp. SC1-56]